MSFVHENPEEFADLIQIIVGETGLNRSIIEKDYWVTHTLWSLSVSGLDIWFKGGTSLSKGASASSSGSPRISTSRSNPAR